MPDMYDKLGEMLNEALESGKIPQSQTDNDQNITDAESDNSGHFILKNDEKNEKFTKKTLKNEKKQQIPTGEVIKMHKYTYNMQYPSHIQKALTTLDIVYSFTQNDITSAYHKKLKETHPDTQNTVQSSKTVQNIRHLTIDDIMKSYKILCNFFGIKKD